MSILRCSGGDGLYEVIVVDNASTDSTRQVVHDLIEAHPEHNLTYVREDRLGLHYARHTGARSARSSLLLYTDDDVLVEPQWIDSYVNTFARHPDMVASGGPVSPRWEKNPPAWLDELVARELSSRELCSELSLLDRGPEFLREDCFFFGVNMAIRYGTLRTFGGFQPELFGDQCLGAGEWGLCMAMRRAGSVIGYVPDARVWHRIGPDRMRPEYFERWAWLASATEMFELWRGRRRTPKSLTGDVWRIVRVYWRYWLKGTFTRRRPNVRAVRLRCKTRTGLYQLVYLWWVMSRRDLREFLDTETFLA